MEQDTNNKGEIKDELGIKRDEKGRFVEGTERHPDAGKKLGTRDFATDFDEVVEEIAEENGITKSQARKHLLKVAYKNAKEGNYSFYKDIHDRVYGQAKNTTDLNLNGKIEIVFDPIFNQKTDGESANK
jgi:hypothetical protein